MSKQKFYYKYDEPYIGEIVSITNSHYPAIYIEGKKESNITIKPPKILFHYCPNKSFEGIMNTGTIWLSSFSNTNDSTELIHLYKIAMNYVYRKKYSLKEKFIVNNLMLNYKKNLLNSFGTSFTNLNDNISQWRGYGDDGKGMAIGFATEKFNLFNDLPKRNYFGENNISLLKVFYDEREQLKIIKDIIDKSIDEPNKVADYALYLSKISCICKNQGFRDEKEWRILYSPISFSSNPILEYNKCIVGKSIRKNKNNEDVPYFIYKFPVDVISDIIIGPKNNYTVEQVKEILKNLNIIPEDINIKKSKITYR